MNDDQLERIARGIERIEGELNILAIGLAVFLGLILWRIW